MKMTDVAEMEQGGPNSVLDVCSERQGGVLDDTQTVNLRGWGNGRTVQVRFGFDAY